MQSRFIASIDEDMKTEPTEILTKNEVAKRLKVAVRTVDQWMRLKQIPFFKIGKTVRFSWPDVMEKFSTQFLKS